MITVERATAADLSEVLQLLNDAAAWLHAKSLNQWPDGFSAERIGPMVARHEVWIARENGRPAGTVTFSAEADPDFWTAAESRQPALYVSKLAITRTDAGLGALLLRWTVDYAARIGCDWARLDAWRTNEQLHAYYRHQGWEHMRTVSLPHRRSGALFQRPAVPDLEARAAFTLVGVLALPEQPVDEPSYSRPPATTSPRNGFEGPPALPVHRELARQRDQRALRKKPPAYSEHGGASRAAARA